MSRLNGTTDKLSHGKDEKLIEDNKSVSANYIDEHFPNETKSAKRDQVTKKSSNTRGRSKANKSSSNKSEIVHYKEDNRITQLLDEDGINKSAQENKSKRFKQYSGSPPHLGDSSNTDGGRQTPPAMYQVAEPEEEGNEMKLRKGSFGDSNNHEECQAEARHVISKESSTRAKGLNGTLDTTKTKRNDTKSKGGNMAAKTNACDDQEYRKNDDQKDQRKTNACDDQEYRKNDDKKDQRNQVKNYYQQNGKHVHDSAESCDSEAEDESTRGSKTATSKRSVPIEHNSADQHDSNIKTTKAISSKVKAHDKTRSCGESKVDVKYTKDVKENAGIIDERTGPRNSSPKYNTGGARGNNVSCKGSLNRSGISAPDESTSSDAETRRHYGEETSKVRNNSNNIKSKIPVCDSASARTRSSSSSRPSRSGGNSGSGSDHSRSSNSRSSSSGSDSSGSDSSGSDNSGSDSSGSDSSRSNNSGSNSTRSHSNSSNGQSSRNGSQSSREGSTNTLNRLAGTGAIPKRDELTAVHSGSYKNKLGAAGNTTSMARNNSESYNTKHNGPNHDIKSEKVSKEFGPSNHLNHSNPIGPNVHLEYEWQYRDDQAGWVTYGQSGGNAPGSKMVTSEDIEKYYTEDPDKTPLLIEFNNNKYILDFQKMKQTSQRTAYQRDIRRILKLPETKKSTQNKGGHSGSRAASGRNNTSGGRYGVGYPLTAGDARADRGMRYDNNTPDETNADNSAQGRDDPAVTYEWQFKDKHGKWIAYGNTNTFLDKSNATTSRSEDIEKAYSNKNRPYYVIKSSGNSYMLDFEQMVQTNKQSQVKRPIRRVVKESPKKGFVAKSIEKLRYLTGQKHNKKGFTTPYEWQFQDERGVWITYGQANSAGNVICTTNTTSDDIEKYFSSGPPKGCMVINSTCNTYRLNCNNMTQTNTRTSIQRPIRRVLKNKRDDSGRNYNRNTAEVSGLADRGYNSAYVAPGRPTRNSASTHLWQFEAERELWITYGESGSTEAGSGTTTATTDDIEEYCWKCNGEMPMIVRYNYNDYILDFQTMFQTNQSTFVQRRMRRIAKPTEITRNHRR